MSIEQIIGLVLSALQVLALLPIWSQWRKLKDAPEQVKQLELNFIASINEVNKRIQKIESTQEALRKETTEDIKSLYQRMEEVSKSTYQTNLRFTEILGKVEGTLVGINLTLQNIDKTIIEYKADTKEDIKELKEKLNGLKQN